MAKTGDKIGPYTLVSKLGRGAFGVVWLAEKRTAITTTKVALKIPNEDDIDLEAVRQEASLWVHASGHPNVLPIIDADIHDEQVIIVSEYAPDGSLSRWLDEHGGKAPSFEAAVEMALGILAGLEHLHSREIIHRDLKPDNILLQGTTPRLADFGIARIIKTTSKSTIATGTPAYMPPEAFDGKRSEQTDIWSVGVIFYQLLTGRLPFAQEEFTSLVGAILTKEPEPLPDSIQRQVREVIDKALQKNPDERFRSAGEMRRALRKAASAPHAKADEEESLQVSTEPTARMADAYAPTEAAMTAQAFVIPPPEATKLLPSDSQAQEHALLPRAVPRVGGRRKLVMALVTLPVILIVLFAILRNNSSSTGSSTNAGTISSTTNSSNATAPSTEPSIASTPTPTLSPSTVQVRLAQVFYNADIQDAPVRRSNVVIEAGGSSFSGLTDNEGVVVFDGVPCGGEIRITAYDDGNQQDVTLRRNLECGASTADLGVLTVQGGEASLEQRRPRFRVFNGEEWVSGKQYERENGPLGN